MTEAPAERIPDLKEREIVIQVTGPGSNFGQHRFFATWLDEVQVAQREFMQARLDVFVWERRQQGWTVTARDRLTADQLMIPADEYQPMSIAWLQEGDVIVAPTVAKRQAIEVEAIVFSTMGAALPNRDPQVPAEAPAWVVLGRHWNRITGRDVDAPLTRWTFGGGQGLYSNPLFVRSAPLPELNLPTL